jgi:hypothetical protein
MFNLAQAISLAGPTMNLQPGSDLYNFIMKQAGLPESGPLANGVDPTPKAVPPVSTPGVPTAKPVVAPAAVPKAAPAPTNPNDHETDHPVI